MRQRGIGMVESLSPTLIFLDLSSACNATCVMCPTQLNPARKKLIDPDLFRRIAVQVAALPNLDWFLIGVHANAGQTPP
jgi:MoaA/NifB/PqqE/SkfB family radical SAM enzyme